MIRTVKNTHIREPGDSEPISTAAAPIIIHEETKWREHRSNVQWSEYLIVFQVMQDSKDIWIITTQIPAQIMSGTSSLRL